jgi:3-methyladenine DNA glycosylase AlkD
MAAKKKSAPKRAPAKAVTEDVAALLGALKRAASPAYKADMVKRYGIVTKAPVYGTPMAKLNAIANQVGVDQALAEALWKTGVHDARMLATLIGDPAKATPALMDRWAKDFDNWGLVDTACFKLFDKSPHAFKQIQAWARAKDEFVKRAGFALLASCALHGHGSEADHLRGLDLIEAHARDPRNFVKKGVNWALRAIGGKKSAKLRSAARELAEQLSVSDDPTERWIGRDAMRAFAKTKT